MSNPPTAPARRRTFDENVVRWRDRVIDRLHARDEGRRPFDRTLFLSEMEADHPGHPRTVETADAFERALDEAHGNPERFRLNLRRLLG